MPDWFAGNTNPTRISGRIVVKPQHPHPGDRKIDDVSA
jgi:hypothetical protein